MKANVNNLTGPALDWAVAMALGIEAIISGAGATTSILYIPPKKRSFYKFTPSTNWKQGGPILDKLIDEHKATMGKPFGANKEGAIVTVAANLKVWWGETILIAAMRCFVASVSGDVVNIPDRLLSN